MCFCCEVSDMDTLQLLQKEIEKYQRLEVERQRLIQQIVELEIEASRDYIPE